jgi:hypothetical protein
LEAVTILNDMSKKLKFTILGGMFVAMAIAVGVICQIMFAPQTTARNTCVNNLRILDSCKQEWALEHKKTTNDIPTWDDLRPYVPNWWTNGMPTCPLSGIYTVGRIGKAPTCSTGGPSHSLPQ